MSSGSTFVQYNSRERMVTDDQNRAISLAARERAEVLRRLANSRGSSSVVEAVEAGGYVNTRALDSAPIATPLRADVFEGLCVEPRLGSLGLFVSPGAVGLDDPDGQTGSSDSDPPSDNDSRYKVVVDPGIGTLGALLMSAGSGGGDDRLDVIECRRTEIVLETDNRDVIDIGTGLVAPATVPKIVAGRLEYRVRAGTPGSPILTLAQGWLPLAVAFVPSTASMVDDMTFWDVRPLVTDRVDPPTARTYLRALQESPELLSDEITAGGETRVSGIVMTRSGAYLAGGVLNDGSVARIDVRAAANHGQAYAPVEGALWHLYLVFPLGLPRWVRYVSSGGLIGPGTLRGIPTVVHVGPASYAGTPTATSIAPPLSTGISGGHPAVHIASGIIGSGPAERGIIADGRVHRFTGTAVGAAPAVLPAASTDTTDRYELVANTHYPKTARSVIVRVATTFNGDAAAIAKWFRWLAVHPAGSPSEQLASIVLGGQHWTFPTPTVSFTDFFDVEVPVPPFQSGAGFASDNLQFTMLWSNTGTTSRSGSSLQVIGWRLG